MQFHLNNKIVRICFVFLCVDAFNNLQKIYQFLLDFSKMEPTFKINEKVVFIRKKSKYFIYLYNQNKLLIIFDNFHFYSKTTKIFCKNVQLKQLVKMKLSLIGSMVLVISLGNY